MVFFSFYSPFLFAHDKVTKNILIYRGAGTCEGCPEAIGAVVSKLGYKIHYIKSGELTAKNFQNAIMYVQPGGSDRVLDTLEALSNEEIKNLQTFIHNGGKYLGVCAGGYLAGIKTEDDNGQLVPAFGLIPSVVEEELKTDDPKVVTINWQNQDYEAYYQGGPMFDLTQIPNAKSFGVYKNSNHSMAILSPYGLGKVGLIGPHLEATKDWFIDDHLPVPKKLNTKLIIDFILSLVNSN